MITMILDDTGGSDNYDDCGSDDDENDGGDGSGDDDDDCVRDVCGNDGRSEDDQSNYACW